MLWDLEDCSMPGFPVLHCLLEFSQIHVQVLVLIVSYSQKSHQLPLPPGEGCWTSFFSSSSSNLSFLSVQHYAVQSPHLLCIYLDTWEFLFLKETYFPPAVPSWTTPISIRSGDFTGWTPAYLPWISSESCFLPNRPYGLLVDDFPWPIHLLSQAHQGIHVWHMFLRGKENFMEMDPWMGFPFPCHLAFPHSSISYVYKLSP